MMKFLQYKILHPILTKKISAFSGNSSSLNECVGWSSKTENMEQQKLSTDTGFEPKITTFTESNLSLNKVVKRWPPKLSQIAQHKSIW